MKNISYFRQGLNSKAIIVILLFKLTTNHELSREKR